MDKKLGNLLKEENIKYYIWVDCKNQTINKVNKTVLGKKTLTIPYFGLDVIKRNNQCNYYRFREYTHDLKSVINSVYGNASIMSFDLEEADEVTGIDIDAMKSMMSDMNESINELVKFASDEVQKQETKLAGKFNLSELLIYYIPTYSNYFVIDSELDADYENAYGVIKRIIELLNKEEKENLIFKKVKDELIVKVWNGKIVTSGTIDIKKMAGVNKSQLLSYES